jgi:hypothetical protein
MKVREIGVVVVGWIHLARGGHRWRSFMVPYRAIGFLSRRGIPCLAERTVSF